MCGACIRRCPVRAIDEERQDKDKCFANVSKFKTDSGLRALIFQEMKDEDYVFGCGLCQAKVPCMEKNPVKGDHEFF
ncbi:MAG: hypothetical protein GX663_05970 [Clostridiales bacterium]|nr:hypothetical protein [Clostridiales bacterium]